MTLLYMGPGKIREIRKTCEAQNQGPSPLEEIFMQPLTYADIVTLEPRIKDAKVKNEAELEAEAIRYLERLGRALDRKRSGYTPKRRGGGYDRCNR